MDEQLIINFLENLGKNINDLGAKGYSVYIAQAHVASFQYAFISVILFTVSFVLYKVQAKLIWNECDDDGEFWKILTALLAIFSLAISIILLNRSISILMNPEYWVMESLLNKIKH